MRFTCNQSDLSSNLALVSRSIPSRPSYPILANVKLKAENNAIRLTGFDLSLGIQTSFIAEIEDEGVITVPAKLFADIVAKLPSGDVTLDDNDGESMVSIESACGRYQLPAISADEYPELPEITATAQTLPIKAFVDGLNGSLVACSSDETKQILTGVHLTATADRLEFAATDGHRLGVVEIAEESEDSKREPFEATIPAKALRELEKMLGTPKEAELLGLQLEQGQAMFEWGDRKLTTRTLDGKYPDYRQLLPAQFKRQVTIDRKQLILALDRISVFADKSSLVKFTIIAAKSSIALSVESRELGNGNESIDCEIAGEDLELGFNIKYLTEGLKILPGSDVVFNINGALEPVILKPLGSIETIYLVMPLQIRI